MGVPVLCMCEGPSDEAFFEELIKHYRLSGQVRVKKVKRPPDGDESAGVNGFHTRFGAFGVGTKDDDVSSCKLLVVIADNDDQPDALFGTVKEQVRAAGYWFVPDQPRQVVSAIDDGMPKLVVVMFPETGVNGNLESVLYEAGRSKHKKLSQCVEAFAKCVISHSSGNWDYSHTAKLKARSLFSGASQKNSDNPIGRAWNDKSGDPFPIKSKQFAGLANYLKQLAKDVSRPATKRKVATKSRKRANRTTKTVS